VVVKTRLFGTALHNSILYSARRNGSGIFASRVRCSEGRSGST